MTTAVGASRGFGHALARTDANTRVSLLGTASASQDLNSNVAVINDGVPWDLTTNSYLRATSLPAWAEIDLPYTCVVSEVVIIWKRSASDVGYSAGADIPTNEFVPSGHINGDVQYWDGSTWQTITSYTNNFNIKNRITFTAVVTSKIRCNFTVGAGSELDLAELEVWGYQAVIASSAGVGTATAVSIQPGVAASSGVAAAAGIAPFGAGAAAGAAVVSGLSGGMGAGSAAGGAGGSAVGYEGHLAAGFASGGAWARAHSPYAVSVTTNLAGIGASVVLAQATLVSGFSNVSQTGVSDTIDGTTNGKNVSPYQYAQFRVTLAAPLDIIGVRVRLASAAPTTYLGVKDNTPPLASTFPWTDTTYEVVTNAPAVGNNDLYFTDSATLDKVRHTGQFDIDAFSNTGSPPATVSFEEIELLTPVPIVVSRAISNAVASETAIIGCTVALTSTLNSTATAVITQAQRLTSVVNTTATAIAIPTETLKVTSVADAESVVAFTLTQILTSVANATATGLFTNTVQCVSTVNTTETTPFVATLLQRVLSQTNATSTAKPFLSRQETSVANATSTIVATPTITLQATSTANATSSATPVGHTTVQAESTFNVTSVAALLGGSITLQLISLANAESYVRLPSGALQCLFTNPHTTAPATWSGLPFNSMIAIGDEVYGAGPSGIYRLEDGVDDNGAPVSAEVMWDLMTFGDKNKKRYEGVYFAGTVDGPLQVRTMNVQGTYRYPTELARADKMVNHRAKLGRGLYSSHLRVAVTNPKGVDFDINNAWVAVYNPTRRS